MSKELTPREALQVFNTWYNKQFFPDELKCLELALDRLEAYDEAFLDLLPQRFRGEK